MKFKSDIEIEAGVAANGSTGSNGQVLSSTGSSVAWINQNAVTSTSDFVFFNVKNETGSTILKGKGVMAVGTHGNSGQILIDEMVADGTVEAKYFLGVLEEDISNGGTARVISFGQLSQFDTRGQNGETWSDGQVLWCDPANNGDFTITEPDGPNLKIAAAFIVNSSPNGKIQVRVQVNEGIHDLHDTKITSQVDGDVLVWDNTTGVWFNDSTLNVDYTNGNVGIGTTSPGAKLDVVSGDIRLGTNATYFRVRDTASAQPRVLGMNASNTFYIGPIDSYAGGGIIYGASSNVSYHGFYSGGSEKMRITSGGNVGIGTTSPGDKLDVVGDVSVRGDLKSLGMVRATGWWNNNSTSNSGHGLEIGVPAPGSTKGIIISYNRDTSSYGDIKFSAVNFNFEEKGGTTTIENNEIWHAGNDGSGSGLDADLLDGQHASAFQLALTNPVTGTGTTNYLSKFTGSTALGNSLVYDNGTNVGIGTTSPGYKLDVAGHGRVAGALRITETGTAQHILIGNQDSTGTDKPAMIRGVNGELHLGHGNSWSSEGGTMTYAVSINNGGVQFPQYGAGGFKGDATYVLGVDSSGNVVETTTSGVYFGTNTSSGTYTNQWQKVLVIDTGNFDSQVFRLRIEGTGNSSGQSIVAEIEFNYKNQNGAIRARTTVNSYGTHPVDKDDIAVYFDTTNLEATFYFKVTQNYTTPIYSIVSGRIRNYAFYSNVIGDDTDLASETNDSITSNLKFQGIVQNQNSGYVGIGTSAPGVNLEVSGEIKATYDSAKNVQIQSNASGGVVKGNGGNGFMFRSYGDSFINGGNVGIGTTSPSYKLDVAGNARFTSEINMEEDHYINLRFEVPDNANSEQYILLCRYAGGNDVNGTITMDRTSGLRHACSVDIIVSAGSSATPVGGLRAIGTSGAGNPKYNLVTCYLDGVQYVALKIENPDGFYESTGAYFTGRIKSTGVKLAPKLESELTSIVDFEANTLHTFSGDTMTGDLTLNNSGQGWLKGYDAYHSIKFRAGGADKTEYYEYGGTLADGLGHKFFTGGTTGQTLKFQVADDGSYFSGNVGIGTSSPTEALMVEGWIRVANNTGIKFNTSASSGDPTLNIDSSAHWNFLNTAGNNLLKIDNGGNVGIGTTSPGAKLEVSNDNYSFINIVTPNIIAAPPASGASLQIGTSGGYGIINSNVDLRVHAGLYSDLIYMSSNSGNVGFGTTNPQERVHVDTGALRVGNIKIQDTLTGRIGFNRNTSNGAIYNSSYSAYQINGPTTSTGSLDIQSYNSSGSFLGVVSINSGNVTANNFILSSDKTLKKNVKDLDVNVDAKWRSYKFKNEDETRYGVIAQELEETNPELVKTDEQGLKSVKYIDLLIAKIAELEARLEKLEK